MNKRKAANIAIALAVFISWFCMIFFGEGSLSQRGIGNLKYFTVLSNLFEGAASVLWLMYAGRGGRAKQRVESIKFAAAVATGLTFAVVMGFLGPMYGLLSLLKGSNLFFHLLIPVAAVAELLFLSDAEYSLKDNNVAALSPLIYGTVYLFNYMIRSGGEWSFAYDWYGFLIWGYPVGIGIFAAICVVTWVIGWLIRKLKRKIGQFR